MFEDAPAAGERTRDLGRPARRLHRAGRDSTTTSRTRTISTCRRSRRRASLGVAGGRGRSWRPWPGCLCAGIPRRRSDRGAAGPGRRSSGFVYMALHNLLDFYANMPAVLVLAGDPAGRPGCDQRPTHRPPGPVGRDRLARRVARAAARLGRLPVPRPRVWRGRSRSPTEPCPGGRSDRWPVTGKPRRRLPNRPWRRPGHDRLPGHARRRSLRPHGRLGDSRATPIRQAASTDDLPADLAGRGPGAGWSSAARQPTSRVAWSGRCASATQQPASSTRLACSTTGSGMVDAGR